eukprot:g901.t1
MLNTVRLRLAMGVPSTVFGQRQIHYKKEIRKWTKQFVKFREFNIKQDRRHARPLHWPSLHLDRGVRTDGWDRSGASGPERGHLRAWARLPGYTEKSLVASADFRITFEVLPGTPLGEGVEGSFFTAANLLKMPFSCEGGMFQRLQRLQMDLLLRTGLQPFAGVLRAAPCLKRLGTISLPLFRLLEPAQKDAFKLEEDCLSLFNMLVPLSMTGNRCTLRRLSLHLQAPDGLLPPKEEVEGFLCSGFLCLSECLAEQSFIHFTQSQEQLVETVFFQLPFAAPEFFSADFASCGPQGPTSTPLSRPLQRMDALPEQRPSGTLISGRLRPSMAEHNLHAVLPEGMQLKLLHVIDSGVVETKVFCLLDSFLSIYDMQPPDGIIPLNSVMSKRYMKNYVLCKYYAENTCTRGDLCRFAHRLDLMRQWPEPPSTRLAASPTAGSTSETSMSRTSDLRREERLDADLRSQCCRNFQWGRCTRGDACRFLHVESTQASRREVARGLAENTLGRGTVAERNNRISRFTPLQPSKQTALRRGRQLTRCRPEQKLRVNDTHSYGQSRHDIMFRCCRHLARREDDDNRPKTPRTPGRGRSPKSNINLPKEKKQLYALQKALRGFRDHSLKLIYDPVALMRRYQKNVGYSDLQEMAKGWLWIDFMCIPQECACWSDEAKQEQEQFLRDAIRSLHTYVAHSSFFLILAPAQHHEKGRLMDYTSWKSRGWCQFELTVNVLMGGRHVRLMRLSLMLSVNLGKLWLAASTR